MENEILQIVNFRNFRITWGFFVPECVCSRDKEADRVEVQEVWLTPVQMSDKFSSWPAKYRKKSFKMGCLECIVPAPDDPEARLARDQKKMDEKIQKRKWTRLKIVIDRDTLSSFQN